MRRSSTSLSSWVERALLAYQSKVSGLKTAPTCRFDPVCSEYAVRAVRKHGAIVGLGKALVRLMKCGPWHPGGYDPV